MSSNNRDDGSPAYNQAPPRRERERSRSRSRSRSPAKTDEGKGRFEKDRMTRMARLRAENYDEERRLAIMDRKEEEKDEAQRRARKAKEQFVQVDQQELEGLDEDEQMKRLLGFSGFASTKGSEVEDNKNSAAKGTSTKNKARKYRQYMNRKGGFSRPLDKMD
eukprot:CAMPEP_0119014294 /NCGR_PEP_ID=MMETSP1176-20130426/9476_1 /TAXON_ID=265551 /ORGANISM="Synedropsis recta cf, Strain CCMP1620" /LENGTH=162 /DNA_ID=CAMNT_0006967449 /DNA_START=19 /DNA_END=504 /DNA_ORIENTATION=+